MKPGDKVIVKATDTQLASIGMTNKKINNNLRKFESVISDELADAKFQDEDVDYKTFVLNGTFTMPELFLKDVNEKEVVDKEICNPKNSTDNKNSVLSGNFGTTINNEDSNILIPEESNEEDNQDNN